MKFMKLAKGLCKIFYISVHLKNRLRFVRRNYPLYDIQIILPEKDLLLEFEITILYLQPT